MIEKTVRVNHKDVKFKSSAFISGQIKRDIFKDLAKLE